MLVYVYQVEDIFMKKEKHTFSVLMFNDWIDRLKEIGAEQDRSVNYLIVKAVGQVYELTGDC